MIGHRIVVIGTSGVGKTTLAARLAARLEVPHIELDALAWEPEWQKASSAVVRERVAAAIAPERWVLDGNYSQVRKMVWARADTLIWLCYPYRVVLWRLLRRTVRRVVGRELLWGTNVESLSNTLGTNSLFLWQWKRHWLHHTQIPVLLHRPEHRHLRPIRLTGPAMTEAWLEALSRYSTISSSSRT